jgi:hypothetical protein
MANDISKNITIGVEMDTDKLTQNITNLNKIIDSLLMKQQQLSVGGQQNSAAFDSVSAKLDVLQKKLQDAAAQVTANVTAVNSLSAANKTAEGSTSSLTAQHQSNGKAAANSSVKIKELSGQLNSLGQSLKQQASSANQGKTALDAHSGSIVKETASVQELQGATNAINSSFGEQKSFVANSKTAFDAHQVTMDHLKTSFDQIKNVSGIFGPCLKEAAEGFNAMKTGLSLVQGGLTGVGEAIKTDGFGFLLTILQLLFDSFVNSSKGAKTLQGVISAIGVVVNDVKAVFNSLMDSIISAFSHPVETLKSLGRMIEENLINRFKAFAVILHGIIHLDFKEIGNGVIQAATGVANATDKINTVFNAVKKGAKEAAGQMVKAYKDGYEQAAQHVADHEKIVDGSNNRQQESYKTLQHEVQKTYEAQDKTDKPAQRGEEIDSGTTPRLSVVSASDALSTSVSPEEMTKTLKNDQNLQNKIVTIKKTALQQVEDYAKQSAGKIATDALNVLTSSIKQQSDAKIAALEKDKAAELTNSTLTSAQKLAIEQKYKQQENQAKVKAFKEEQEASIAQAVINGALAITKGTAQTGVLATLFVPVIIAETAVQVAKIASQKPPAYAKGGLHYSSDGRGGVLPGYSKADNTNAYLRSGEGIVVSEAMQVPWARNLVSAINVGFGGRDFAITNPGRGFAVGGIFTDGGDANRYYNQPVADQKNLANTIAYQMINNFPPVYVDVKDVNNQQNILAQTINRVNL